jgi:hypothetical protein
MGLEEGIRSPLRADCTGRPVTRIDPQIVAKGKYLVPHPFHEFLVASPLKISSTHRSCEESVPRKNCARRNETNPSGRMSGSVNDRQGISAYLNLHPFRKAPVGRNAEGCSIVGVNEDRCFGDPFQFLDSADVIDVAVGDQDLLYADPVLGDLFGYAENFIAWIDDNAFKRVFASQDVAICLIRTYRQFSKHYLNLLRSSILSQNFSF